MDEVLGIDISHHQKTVDFDALWNGGFKFCFIKCTEGVGYRDPAFTRHWEAAGKTGVLRGAYHFARPDTVGGEGDGELEAKSMIREILDAPGCIRGMLPPVLDYEKYSPQDVASDRGFIRGFVRIVMSYLGVYPIIYTGRNVWKYQTGNSDEWADLCPLWLVRYTSKKLQKPHHPLPWKDWTFWQFSGGGDFRRYDDPVPGTLGVVDVNRFNGTFEQLQAMKVETTKEIVQLRRELYKADEKVERLQDEIDAKVAELEGR